jgi:predicted porin
VEQTARSANVGLAQVFGTVDNGRSDGAGDTVVVGFADSAEGGDVGFEQVVLGQVCASVYVITAQGMKR